MWLENETLRQDMERVCKAEFIPWESLRGKTVLVTGATGLIGGTTARALLYANRQRGLGLTVLALVRDEARARQSLGMAPGEESGLRLLAGSVEAPPSIDGPVDYIIHGASQTASQAFARRPVETIATALRGTESLLELGRQKGVRGFVYLSSMEVYGLPKRGHKVTEDEIGALSPLDVRNSYPISKQQCEAMCCAYASEYGVPAMTVRLTQTFGPGVAYNDGRIFAELARCALEKRDIVLKTKGETERSYLYTADAAAAILAVLLKGEPGTAYNAADEVTYCSIAEMARLVAEKGGVDVRFAPESEGQSPYLPTLYMDLDTGRLKALGWAPADGMGLAEMFERMMGDKEYRTKQ